jgi:transposase
MSRPSKYPPEFRREGAAVSGFGGPHYRGGGRELGVGAETFRKWMRQDKADRGEAPEKPTSAQLAKFSRLKRDPRHMPPPARCSAPPWQVA